ncbi:hypothetical protein GJ496_007510 [Pomphorhynchus laevis]|nr:hypothetical protein GJ496_007510 [Pomphorhynchus laevis]
MKIIANVETKEYDIIKIASILNLRMTKYKITCHNLNFSDKDIIVNPKSDLKPGYIVELTISPRSKVLFMVEETREEIKSSDVSIAECILRLFRISNYEYYEIAVKSPDSTSLSCLELLCKDPCSSRYDQYILSKYLIGKCVYHKKIIDYIQSRFVIHAMWMGSIRVSSGYINKNTQLIFRTLNGHIILFLQVSSELWKCDRYGDQYLENMTDYFLDELFQKWKAMSCQHYLSIVLFARVICTPLQNCNVENSKYNSSHEDFYKTIFQYQQRDEWTWCIYTIKQSIQKFAKKIISILSKNNKYANTHDICLSHAYNGNIFETLSHVASSFTSSRSNCQFSHVGQNCIIVSASSGLFEVERLVFNLVRRCLLDDSVDIVCLGEQPLHVVPMVKFVTTKPHKSYFISPSICKQLILEDYYIPSFINISFYRCPHSMKEPVSDNRSYNTLSTKQQIFSLIKNPHMLGPSGPAPKCIEDMIEYDKQVFRKENERKFAKESSSVPITLTPVRKRCLTYNYSIEVENLPHEGTCRSQQIFAIKASNLSDNLSDDKNEDSVPLLHRSMSFDSGIDIYVKSGKVNSNARNFNDKDSCQEKFSVLGLFNPLDPAHISLTLPFHRRRWMNNRPRDENGRIFHPHHKCPAVVNKSNDFIFRSTLLFRNYPTSPRRRVTENRYQSRKEFDNELCWIPGTIIGVDWKSLTIPACLPIYIDRMPTRKELVNNYIERTVAFYPNLVRKQLAQSNVTSSSPFSVDQVYCDMIGLRLLLGFQIVHLDGTCRHSTTSGNSPRISRINQALVADSLNNSSLIASAILTDGRNIHELCLTKTGFEEDQLLKILQLCNTRRADWDTQPFIHRFYYCSLHDDDVFTLSNCTFEYCPKPQRVWQSLDNYLCVQSNAEEYHYFEDLDYMKTRLYLLPNDDLQSLSIPNISLQEKTAEERLKFKDRLQKFINFMDMLNKLKCVSVFESPKRKTSNETRFEKQNIAQLESCRFDESSTVEQIVMSMMSELTFSVDITTNTLPVKTFISARAVWWCMENMKHINTVSEAINFMQELLDRNYIVHTSRESVFYFGMYLYYFPCPENTDYTHKPRDFCEVRFCNREHHVSVKLIEQFQECQDISESVGITPFLNTEFKLLVNTVNVDVDSNHKSDRIEWASAKYPTFFHPHFCFDLLLCWLVTTGALMSELVASWCRRSIQHGFTFVPGPTNPTANFHERLATLPEDNINAFGEPMDSESLKEQSYYKTSSTNKVNMSLHLNSIYRSVCINVNFDFLKDNRDYSRLLVKDKHLKIKRFLQLILWYFDFIESLCVLPEDSRKFYIHKSGLAFVSIVKQAIPESYKYLWMNNFQICRRWRTSKSVQSSTNSLIKQATSSDQQADQLKSAFTSFCQNEDNRLNIFWTECSKFNITSYGSS